MNTSIIIDDIRKRSIKIQRDKILEKIRQEEELEAVTLPRKIIQEAEERAKEKIALQGWKRNLSFVVIFLGAGYAIYRILMAGKQKLNPRKPPSSTSFAIQTETILDDDDDVEYDAREKTVINDERKTIKFNIPKIKDRETEKLKTVYPKHWKEFERDYEPPWLVSRVSGQMSFGFYHSGLKIGIDMITSEMLEFPNKHFSTQEDFENSIYDRQLKTELSEDYSVTYKIVNLDLEFEEDED